MAQPSFLQSGVRFRALPTQEQTHVLGQWIGCQRFIYNGKIDEDRLFAAQRRMALRDGALECPTPLDQQYAQFKTPELSPWLCDVPSQILRNGAVRWRNAKQRQLKGLAKAPRRRNRANFNSVMVTSELFAFRPDVDPATGESGFRLLLGTKSRSLGELKFKAHRPYGLPNVITITRESRNHWYVSFNYAHACDEILRPPAELAYELNGLRDEELEFVSTGADRNVRENCVATSEGVLYSVPAIVKERLTRKAKGERSRTAPEKARAAAEGLKKPGEDQGQAGAQPRLSAQRAERHRAQDQLFAGNVRRKTVGVRRPENQEHGAQAKGPAGQQRALAAERPASEGWPEQVHPAERLGPDPELHAVQGGTAQYAGAGGAAARLIPGVFPVRAHPPREPERRPVPLYRLWFLSARGYQRGVHDSAPRHQETARRADQGESRETGVFQKAFEQGGTARCACGARVRRGRRRKMTVARCASKQEVDSCEARSTGLQAGEKSRSPVALSNPVRQ